MCTYWVLTTCATLQKHNSLIAYLSQWVEQWVQALSWSMYCTEHQILKTVLLNLLMNGQYTVLHHECTYLCHEKFKWTKFDCRLSLPKNWGINCGLSATHIPVHAHISKPIYLPWGRVQMPASMLWSKSHHKSPEIVCEEMHTCICKPRGLFNMVLPALPQYTPPTASPPTTCQAFPRVNDNVFFRYRWKLESVHYVIYTSHSLHVYLSYLTRK